MSLPPPLFRSFIVLADTLHFGRAAQELNIAQSVLSVHIKRLEDIIGARLFERGRRAAVSLTTAGATFLVEARFASDQFERAIRIGRLAARSEAGPFPMGYVFSAALCGLLVKALGTVRRDLPHADLQAIPLDTPEQIERIAQGRLDLGLIRPRETYPAGVSATVVHREPLLLAFAEGHPLATRATIHAGDLAEETFIIPQFYETGGLSQPLMRLARTGGFALRPFRATSDYVTAIGMAAADYGVVLAPHSIRNLPMDGMCYRSVADYGEQVELALAYRTQTPAVRSILGAHAIEQAPA